MKPLNQRSALLWVALFTLAAASACGGRDATPTLPASMRSDGSDLGASLPKKLVNVVVADVIASQGGSTPKPPTTNGVFMVGPSVAPNGIGCWSGTVTPLPDPSGAIGCKNGSFAQPKGIAIDAHGNLYVADQGVQPHQTFSPPPAFAGPGIYKLSKKPGSQTVLVRTNVVGLVPTGVAVDGASPPNVYFSGVTGTGGAVFEFSGPSKSGTTTTIATGLPVPIGSVAVKPNCISPCTVYVADYGSGKVYVFTPSNGTWKQSTIGSGFQNPYGVAVDGSGNVYVADVAASSIVKIAAGTGKMTCVIGGATPAPDGTCSQEDFHKPHGVAVDGDGNVYVADSNHGSIKMVTAGGTEYCIAPPSANKCSGSHIVPGSAGFYHPNAVVPYPYPTPST